MKAKYILAILTLAILITASCIKDEPLNPESDITAFEFADSLKTGKVFINNSTNEILLYLTDSAYARGLRPEIRLSKGASVTPLSSALIHFDQPIEYLVRSENGSNERRYKVRVVNVGNWTFNFERWKYGNDEHSFQNPLDDDGEQVWSSGNAGVAIAGATTFPTRPSNDGLDGSKAAMMVTREGTPLSIMFSKVHLFAGNLFLGNFNMNNVLLNPLQATEFGQPYVGQPSRFSGYYSYQPGTAYQDEKGNLVNGKTDECSIYAVFYNGPERLNATNINDSYPADQNINPRIIAVARLQHPKHTKDLTAFDIPFEYRAGVTAGAKTMMAIVASSSINGDHYQGAVGSTLIVDNLKITAQ